MLRTLGFYINFRQLAINGHKYCVLAHASPLSVLKHALRRKCSLMATPSKRDSVNAQSSFKFRSVDSQTISFWLYKRLGEFVLPACFSSATIVVCTDDGIYTIMTRLALSSKASVALSCFSFIGDALIRWERKGGERYFAGKGEIIRRRRPTRRKKLYFCMALRVCGKTEHCRCSIGIQTSRGYQRNWCLHLKTNE